ncbi:MAG: hypothetical protein R3B46_04255 [Phycisphaerales bacterium]|nr:hypothetical protein [Phycisphaerales bacterium]
MKRAAGPTRRGFTFLLVLGLLALAVVLTGVMLERQRTQGAIVQMQMENIERHHELLSVRDIARRWFQESTSDEDLLIWSATGEVATAIRMPGGQVYQVRVSDGQGTVCARMDKADRLGMRDRLLEILRRLPEGRPDLIRKSGPIQISFNGAASEVIDALAQDDVDMAGAMHRLRAAGVADREAFITAMESAGLNSEDYAWALDLLAFKPVLWRLRIDVFEGDDEPREYTVLVERRVNVAYVYEWRSIPMETFVPAAGDDPNSLAGADDRVDGSARRR